MTEAARPFDSIEDTQEFIALLEESIQEAIRDLESELALAQKEHHERRAEALNLALYKLGQLRTHTGRSRRIVNDLRSLRRLLSNERQPA